MMSNCKSVSLPAGQSYIVISHLLPVPVDVRDPVLIHRLITPAPAIRQHPLPVIVNRQAGLDEHLDGSVEGNDDQHPLSVAQGTRP